MVSKRSLQAKQKVPMMTIMAPVPPHPQAPIMAPLTQMTDVARFPLTEEDPEVDFRICPQCDQRFPLAMLNMHMIIVHPAPNQKRPSISCGFRGCKFECERNEVMIHHKDIAHKEARMDAGELVCNIKDSMETLKTEFMENNPGIACGLRFDINENKMEQQQEQQQQSKTTENDLQHQPENQPQLPPQKHEDQQNSSFIGDTSINSMTTVPPNTPNTSFAPSPIFSGGLTPILREVTTRFDSGTANIAVASPVNTPMTKSTPTRGGRGKGRPPTAGLFKKTLNANSASPAVPAKATPQSLNAASPAVSSAKATPQRSGAKKRNLQMPINNSASPNQMPRLVNQAHQVKDELVPDANPPLVQNSPGVKMPDLAYKDGRTCPVQSCAQSYKNSHNVRRHLNIVHKLSEIQLAKIWDEVLPTLAN